MTEKRANIPAFRVTLDGQDLTDRLSPRLLSLSLTEKRGGAADELELVLNDHDGTLAMPRKGALLRVSIGWRQGADVPVGLVDKGSFKVDEAEHSGAPDIITVRARSADMTAGFRVRKDRSWTGKTVATVIGEVAADNGLSPQVHPDLAAKIIPALGFGGKSDMALVRELGKRFDAVATVKAGNLLFMPAGSTTTPTGKAIPGETLTRAIGDRHRYSLVDRDQYGGVEASYHDDGAAERKTVTVGAGGGDKKAKKIRKVHATKAEAQQAAEAEASRMKRREATMDLTVALGRPDLYPNRPLTLSGWKPEISARKWVIEEAQHQLDGDGGLVTQLKLESS